MDYCTLFQILLTVIDFITKLLSSRFPPWHQARDSANGLSFSTKCFLNSHSVCAPSALCHQCVVHGLITALSSVPLILIAIARGKPVSHWNWYVNCVISFTWAMTMNEPVSEPPYCFVSINSCSCCHSSLTYQRAHAVLWFPWPFVLLVICVFIWSSQCQSWIFIDGFISQSGSSD